MYLSGIGNGVQHGGSKWSFLTWTKKHSSLHRQPEVSREVVEETLLIIQESQYCSLLALVDAVSRWMFSSPDLLQGFWFVHLQLENKFSFFGKISPLSHWVFPSRFPMRSSFSNSSRSSISTSPFQIPPAYRAYFFPNWWIRDWSFAVLSVREWKTFRVSSLVSASGAAKVVCHALRVEELSGQLEVKRKTGTDRKKGKK